MIASCSVNQCPHAMRATLCLARFWAVARYRIPVPAYITFIPTSLGLPSSISLLSWLVDLHQGRTRKPCRIARFFLRLHVALTPVRQVCCLLPYLKHDASDSQLVIVCALDVSATVCFRIVAYDFSNHCLPNILLPPVLRLCSRQPWPSLYCFRHCRLQTQVRSNHIDYDCLILSGFDIDHLVLQFRTMPCVPGLVVLCAPRCSACLPLLVNASTLLAVER
jgi:hypothetical protein